MNKRSLKTNVVLSPLKRLYYHYVYWRIFNRDRDAIRSMIKKVPQSDRPSMIKMWWILVGKLWLPEEYFSYHYDLLSRKGQKQYVLNWEKEVFAKTVNKESVHELLDDKYGSFLHFKEYYKRDVIKVDFANKDLDAITTFLEAHPKVMVKQNTNGGGHGIQIVNVNDFDNVETLLDLLQEQYKSKKIIFEELIQQDERMACFHPQSVNTLRMPAIRIGEKIVFLHPGMRIGRGESIVDNGGSGGILAAIDMTTGIIKAAATEDGTDYCIHPDTKVPIVGYQVPLWDEAQAFAKELMRALPEGVYISWDLALSDKGWMMVEGNGRGQFFGRQLPIHRGIRKEFNEIKKKLNI